MQSCLLRAPLSEDEHSLAYILETGAITPYFQPIFDFITGDVIGHESLSRGPEGSPLFYPDKLFQTAVASGQLHSLELLCREKALHRFAELDLPGKLFINISASLLSSPDHQKGMTLAILDRLGISRDRIVIELSEQHPYDHFGLSRASVEYYRRMGFSIAIDDLGVGYSGLRMWSELQPDYVKIDKHFIQDIDKDTVKREFVRSIIAIAQSLRCEVIAEGIETQTELDMLIELGVVRGQGFLLGHPQPDPSQFHSRYLVQRSLRAEQRNRLDEGETVLSLSRSVPTVQTQSALGELDRLFKRNPELVCMPVLGDQGEPLGVVRRSDLLELFSTQYGRALSEQKPVSRLLRTDVVIVESYVSLAKVSYQLTNQENNHLNNDIIIVQDGGYLGMGSLRDLLKRITELKIQNATYSNPLTMLPGSVPINREIDRRLKLALDFRVAYFDLNDFKPFNDFYGYAKGDQVIQLLSKLVKQYATGNDNFIGHVGGDDFVVIMGTVDWEVRCLKILEQFELQIRDLYAPKELQAGGIWSRNRAKEPCFYKLLSLAVGVVYPDPYRCESHLEVSELAAQAKKQAKQIGGNTLFVSRRRKLRTGAEKVR